MVFHVRHAEECEQVHGVYLEGLLRRLGRDKMIPEFFVFGGRYIVLIKGTWFTFCLRPLGDGLGVLWLLLARVF